MLFLSSLTVYVNSTANNTTYFWHTTGSLTLTVLFVILVVGIIVWVLWKER
ncbi:MAG: hypothetical protein QW203_06740 [Thermoplasmatales archaeon]